MHKNLLSVKRLELPDSSINRKKALSEDIREVDFAAGCRCKIRIRFAQTLSHL
jgi:hypothetical protein